MTNILKDNKGNTFLIQTCKYCTDYKGDPNGFELAFTWYPISTPIISVAWNAGHQGCSRIVTERELGSLV
jgi:hypothetical protein